MIKKNNSNNNWDIVIKSKTSLFDLKLSELYIYRDLILLFVKRDFVTFYKQTILGPIWYIIQPLVNTIVFTVIFGNLAKIPTDEVPPFIFYMAGTVSWGYFATCLSSTGNTFVSYKEIFGKVYFPRLIVPASNVLISLLQLSIQLFIFLCFLIYFKMSGSSIHPNFYLFFYPLVVLQTALLSFGCGILISALTAKYRDLTFVMSFGIQLWMYATPIVYPLSIVPEKYRFLVSLNPMTSVVELTRFFFLGVSAIEPIHVVTSLVSTIVILFIGILMFNQTEKNFMDTV